MPDGIEIYFSASLAPGQREIVEQSIASAAERTRAEADAARERAVEEDKLHDAITARLAKPSGPRSCRGARRGRHAAIQG
ncbi:hypothetical protein [Mesorhizobium sp. AA22]|uniref:hypothetical protein n=1 Tax=Mesorhizobium sp. AA22 TaxID=1854057 RepID=UPI0012E9BD79|nr:hypothetical protein [Mesorhizobium sp. AA22]QIA24066.1 hypothetical protein A9K68_021470 [Mesorhizobium sp. AA22]